MLISRRLIMRTALAFAATLPCLALSSTATLPSETMGSRVRCPPGEPGWVFCLSRRVQKGTTRST